MIYKVIGGRRMEEDEVRELVEKGQVGPLDGFISAKSRARFSALLKLTKDAETGKYKAEYDFGDKVDLGTVEPYWTDPKSGAQLCEVGSSHVLRERDTDGWKQSFRIGRLMCQKPITREHAIQLVSVGKTELIKGFISKKGRPFDAFLKREGARFTWEFPPRAPKVDKDGNPIARKSKTPPDLSKGAVIGKSKMHHDGEIVETPEAYHVRRPDQDNRVVFTLKKDLCGRKLVSAEVMPLFETGRTDLIPGFMSKRGMPFGAYLVLSKTGAKADFEFPPR
jgi:DNA topoisomerase-3